MAGAASKRAEIFGEVGAGGRELDAGARSRARRGRARAGAGRPALLGERVRGNFGGDAAVMQHAQQAVGGDAADLDGVESPLAEDGEDFLLAAALGDQQHALLRFAEHHFVGVMPVSRCGTRARSISMPTPPREAISQEVLVSPAAPMS